MNGRIYDPKLGRMLSPDPVTQAPENGQNYNRYTYANNNPLKYSDPSGFCFSGAGADTAACAKAGEFIFSSVASFVLGGIFGGNGCDRTCKDRRAAHNWCKAQSTCLAELRANTREKYRRRSAQVILEATQTGQSYYYENGRAHLGDQTSGGFPSGQNPIVGQRKSETVGTRTVTKWEQVGIGLPAVLREGGTGIRGGIMFGINFGFDRFFNKKNKWIQVATEYDLTQDYVYEEYYYGDDSGVRGQFTGWVKDGEVYADSTPSQPGVIVDEDFRSDFEGEPTGGAWVVDEYE